MCGKAFFLRPDRIFLMNLVSRMLRWGGWMIRLVIASFGGPPMKLMSFPTGALVLAALLWTQPAQAHGIAGNRYFDGTMTFDDPAVADEAILPYYENLAFPTQGSNATQNRINWAFARLLTPTLAVTVDSGWLHQNWPIGRTSGFDKTNLGVKYEAYRNNQ